MIYFKYCISFEILKNVYIRSMKKYIYLLLVFIGQSTLFAQITEVKWGEEYEKEGGMTAQVYVLDFQDDFYYVVSEKKDQKYLMKFNLDHQLLETSDLILSNDPDLNDISDVLKIQNETYIYNQKFNDETKVYDLYFAKFSNGQIVTKYEKVLSKDFSDVAHLRWLPYFDFIYSQDSSKILMRNFLYTEKNRELELIQLIVLDTEFNVLWDKLQEIPYKDKKTIIQNTRVSNDGEVFLCMKVDRNIFEKEPLHPNYDFVVAKINEKEYLDHLIVFDDNDIVPKRSIIHLNEENQEIITAGLYSKRSLFTSQNGVFSNNTNFDFKNEKTKFEEFRSADLAGLVSDKQSTKEKGLTNAFKLTNYYVHKDGTFSLVLEERYTTSYTTTSGQTRTTFHSDEIVILKFSVDGNLDKIAKIDKEFKSPVEDITSFCSFEYNGSIYFMFNDQKDREERQFIGSNTGKFSRCTDVVKIDENGELVLHKTLFTNKQVSGEFVPSRIEQHKNMLLIRTKRIGVSSLFVSKFSFGLFRL